MAGSSITRPALRGTRWKQIGLPLAEYTDLFPRAISGRKLGGVTRSSAPTPRQRLLDAAADLFYREGIGAVGVDLVSKAAGVSKRTMYQQFGSKDRLIAESLDAHGAAILGLYIPAEDPGASARQQILAVFDGLGRLTASETFRGCPFINTATELADPGHPARRVARGYKLRLREFFARQAERGQAKDPQRLADELIIVFDGAMVQAVMGTARHPDAAWTAVQTLLDAHGVR
jgi:AcrR family transcriptional regulator